MKPIDHIIPAKPRTESHFHRRILVGALAALLLPSLANAEDTALNKQDVGKDHQPLSDAEKAKRIEIIKRVNRQIRDAYAREHDPNARVTPSKDSAPTPKVPADQVAGKDYKPGMLAVKYIGTSPIAKQAQEILLDCTEWNEKRLKFEAKLEQKFEAETGEQLGVGWWGWPNDASYDVVLGQAGSFRGWGGTSDPSLAVCFGDMPHGNKEKVKRLAEVLEKLKTAGTVEDVKAGYQDVRITLPKDSALATEWAAIRNALPEASLTKNARLGEIAKTISDDSKIAVKVKIDEDTVYIYFDPENQDAMEKYFQSQQDKKVIEYFSRDNYCTLD